MRDLRAVFGRGLRRDVWCGLIVGGEDGLCVPPQVAVERSDVDGGGAIECCAVFQPSGDLLRTVKSIAQQQFGAADQVLRQTFGVVFDVEVEMGRQVINNQWSGGAGKCARMLTEVNRVALERDDAGINTLNGTDII